MDIDTAVERDMYRKAETEDTELPKKGECAVCGRPIRSALPPRKDPDTPKFCDEHGKEDLLSMREQEHFERMQEQLQERYERL